MSHTLSELEGLFRNDNPFPYIDPDEAAAIAFALIQAPPTEAEILGQDLAALKDELTAGANINNILGIGVDSKIWSEKEGECNSPSNS